MKKTFIALATVLAAAFSNASVESIQIPTGSTHTFHAPAKVVQVKVLSTVPGGTATVKAASDLVGAIEDVQTSYFTNVTYSLVYSNGTETVTNTVDVDYSPSFPTNMSYIAYRTNTLVTAETVTNVSYGAILTVTNDLNDAITCSGGYGSATPTNKTISPGDRLFCTGTARGAVTVIIER